MYLVECGSVSNVRPCAYSCPCGKDCQASNNAVDHIPCRSFWSIRLGSGHTQCNLWGEYPVWPVSGTLGFDMNKHCVLNVTPLMLMSPFVQISQGIQNEHLLHGWNRPICTTKLTCRHVSETHVINRPACDQPTCTHVRPMIKVPMIWWARPTPPPVGLPWPSPGRYAQARVKPRRKRAMPEDWKGAGGWCREDVLLIYG